MPVLKSPRPVFLAGDFNAHSALWGSRRGNRRGGIVKDWTAQLGLVLLNRGLVSTCVRPQGESIVDLTWATPRPSLGAEGWRRKSRPHLITK